MARLDPDTDLMLRVRADEPGAFEELMLRYRQRLVDLLRHLVGQVDEAEDLAQEVLLRVYRVRKRYRVRSKFGTWLFTIANNLARNCLLTRRRHPMVPLPVRSVDTPRSRVAKPLPLSPASEPGQDLEYQELTATIRRALAELNDRQRLAVLLHSFQGKDYATVAAAMDLTPQAVKSLLCRARSNLRAALWEYLSPDG
jgi:RNA polymerase sigma-70 factor (ECF subfamily)